MMKKRTLFVFSVLLSIVLGCKKHDIASDQKNVPLRARQKQDKTISVLATNELTPKPPAQPSQMHSQPKIVYEYEDADLAISGIPSRAVAFDGKRRISEAKFIRIIEKDPGPNHFEIEETYFSEEGDITYQGTILMRPGSGDGIVVEIKPILGKREAPVFDTWPLRPPSPRWP